jgi:hypothetical protein
MASGGFGSQHVIKLGMHLWWNHPHDVIRYISNAKGASSRSSQLELSEERGHRSLGHPDPLGVGCVQLP